jgi:hypothetical protein
MAIFIDDNSKGRNASWWRRHWSVRGKTPFSDTVFTGSHGKTYTLLATCDLEGFIPEACKVVEQELGYQDNDPTCGTIDGKIFEMWVEQKLCPVLWSYDLAEPHSVVIMDNASQHHSDIVCELIESTGVWIIYLPPYSPNLNPIELMFGNYKMLLKHHHSIDWLVAHQVSLLNVAPQNTRNVFLENAWFRVVKTSLTRMTRLWL